MTRITHHEDKRANHQQFGSKKVMAYESHVLHPARLLSVQPVLHPCPRGHRFCPEPRSSRWVPDPPFRRHCLAMGETDLKPTKLQDRIRNTSDVNAALNDPRWHEIAEPTNVRDTHDKLNLQRLRVIGSDASLAVKSCPILSYRKPRMCQSWRLSWYI